MANGTFVRVEQGEAKMLASRGEAVTSPVLFPDSNRANIRWCSLANFGICITEQYKRPNPRPFV